MRRDDVTQPWDDDRNTDPRFDDVPLAAVDPSTREWCSVCGYQGEAEAFAVRFCPSDPDKCSGCEVDPSRRTCPECGYEWRTDAHPF